MKHIDLSLKSGHTVNIHIDFGLLKQVAYIKQQLGQTKRLFIVTQSSVYDLHVKALESALSEHLDVRLFIVPDGEEAKSLSQAENLLSQILEGGVERQDTLMAIGGGVVGDLGGFIASICLRGINLIQVPTTLLSQVDAAIGGKTGVNHPTGKNLIGSFYQPQHIFIDPSLLSTLSPRECRSGFAEVIKYGVIRNTALFDRLEANQNILNIFDFEANKDLWLEVIAASVQDKVDVVTEDEKESGLRATLNFGHTIGHGIEAFFDYGTYKHGECVAMGMVAAAHISVQKQLLSGSDAERVYQLIRAYDYDKISLNSFSTADIMPFLKRDKKVKQQKLHFVLATAVGKVFSDNSVTEDEIDSSVQFICDFFKEA